MSEMRHERPGVYSVYDASSVTSAGRAAKRIGVAALAVKGTANTAVTLTGYGAGAHPRSVRCGWTPARIWRPIRRRLRP